jgi:hypothetical protein
MNDTRVHRRLKNLVGSTADSSPNKIYRSKRRPTKSMQQAIRIRGRKSRMIVIDGSSLLNFAAFVVLLGILVVMLAAANIE